MMNKSELRKSLLESGNAAGSAHFETDELRKVQKNTEDGILTISVDCGAAFTLICCG